MLHRIFRSLEQSEKLENLVFHSQASSWPESETTWKSLRTLDISRWKAFKSIQSKLQMPKLKQLVCTLEQINLDNIPSNITHLRIVHSTGNIKGALKGLEKYKALIELELCDFYEEISVSFWETILKCTSLKCIRIEQSQVPELPKEIGMLDNLEVIILYRTNTQVSPHIFNDAPSLKRIEIEDLRGKNTLFPQ